MSKIEEPAREGFLYHLWVERAFDHVALKTVDGRPVEILEKGKRNFDAGPDFLQALIRIDGNLARGDVEIHSIAGDWYAHAHHNDPRYNNVVLHIVTMDCPATFRTLNQLGQSIPTLNLDDYLEKSAEELEEEAAEQPVPEGICALSSQVSGVVRQILESAGDTRFAVKAARYAERRHAESWDQLIYAAIFDALGFSKNQLPFRNLAAALPVEQIWRFIWNDPPERALLKCEAILFGAAGLLPSQSSAQESGGHCDYVRALEAIWQSAPFRQKIAVLKQGSWQFFRLRPANFPTRRLAAGAALVIRFMEDGFVGAFQKVMRNGQKKHRALVRELEQMLIVPDHEFWSRHTDFAGMALQKEQHLLGSERARDMVVNVFLPALAAYAEEIDDLHLKIAAKEVYAGYPPLKENEITRRMKLKIFNNAPLGREMVSSARMQQGLIHLSKEKCIGSSCRRCLEEGVP